MSALLALALVPGCCVGRAAPAMAPGTAPIAVPATAPAVAVLADPAWVDALAGSGIRAEPIADLPALIHRCEQDPPPRFVVAVSAGEDPRLALVSQAMTGLNPDPWIAVGPVGKRLLNGSGTPREAVLLVHGPADAATVAAILRRP
jgi:hypothetical protein